MNRDEKQVAIANLKAMFEASQTLVIAKQSGMTVAESTDLRKQMRDAGSRLKVVKNTLARLAIVGTNFEPLAHEFVGPTLIGVSEDPIAAAKVMVDYAKTNEKIEIQCGAYGTTVLDAAGIKTLASMPSLDEIRGTLVCLLQTPASRMASVLQAPAGQVARVLSAYSSKDAA